MQTLPFILLQKKILQKASLLKQAWPFLLKAVLKSPLLIATLTSMLKLTFLTFLLKLALQLTLRNLFLVVILALESKGLGCTSLRDADLHEPPPF